MEGFAPRAAVAVDDDVLDTLATVLTDIVRSLVPSSSSRLIVHEASAQALDMCDVLFNLARDYHIPVTLISESSISSVALRVDSCGYAHKLKPLILQVCLA